VFENRVLRRMLGPERDEVTGGCREMQYKNLHNLYISSNIIRMINSRGMRWQGHVPYLAAVSHIQCTQNLRWKTLGD
jgi:hypothetical protein